MYRCLLLVSLVICIVNLSTAQPYRSRLGRFEVDQIKGCAPFTVTILSTNLFTTGECTATKPCLMDFNGTSQQQNVFTFTYTTPGTYTLKVLYQSIGQDDITITVDQNIQPPFDIYACSSNRVSVKVNDNSYDQYLIDFNNDGVAENTQPFTNNIVAQHSYAAAGTYAISVRGRDLNSADNCAARVQNFTSRATLPAPSITSLSATSATSLQLNFTNLPDIQYRLEIAVNNASTFQLLQYVYQTTSFTVPNLRVDDNYYCFRVGAYDPCTGTSTYSSVICSQNFDLSIQNGVNRLAWVTANNGINSVTIQRNGANYTTIPGSPASFSDNDVICNTDYCYRIVSNYGGGATSTSLEKCGTAFTTIAPPAINNVTSAVGVQGSGVELSWTVSPIVNNPEFTILRQREGGPFASVGSSATTTYTDATYATSDRFCYRIDYSDACGNESADGAVFCPLVLTGELNNQNITRLNWTKYNGWASGVQSYVVERYNRDGTLLSTVNVGTDTFYVEDPDVRNQFVRYRVRAAAVSGGLGNSFSNGVEFTKETNLFSPTAFTPNNDKLNDGFTVGGQYITRLSLKIFDRWGVLIFTSGNNEPWNGTRSDNGQPMPPGTYVWKAEGTDQAGRTFTRDGTVLLIRK